MLEDSLILFSLLLVGILSAVAGNIKLSYLNVDTET